MIVVGIVAFMVGMVGVLILTGWLMWRFVEPGEHWWTLLHTSILRLIFSVIGGLALAAGAMSLLSRWHFRRGVHRCAYCSKPLRGIGIPCDCLEVQALRRTSFAS